MDFQRYYDGVGLIVENKINNSFSTCPLCGEMKVDWEIVFDFKGDLICVLAKCPHCGGVIKTIFNFNNGEMPSCRTPAKPIATASFKASTTRCLQTGAMFKTAV